MKKPPETFH